MRLRRGRWRLRSGGAEDTVEEGDGGGCGGKASGRPGRRRPLPASLSLSSPKTAPRKNMPIKFMRSALHLLPGTEKEGGNQREGRKEEKTRDKHERSSEPLSSPPPLWPPSSSASKVSTTDVRQSVNLGGNRGRAKKGMEGRERGRSKIHQIRPTPIVKGEPLTFDVFLL